MTFNILRNNNSYNIGIYTEFLAKWYLRFHGYKILETRYITGKGTNASELDIITSKSNTLVFIEVKRRQNLKDALQAIALTENRLKNAAEIFIKTHKNLKLNSFRFDAITFDKNNHLTHHKNIIKN